MTATDGDGEIVTVPEQAQLNAWQLYCPYCKAFRYGHDWIAAPNDIPMVNWCAECSRPSHGFWHDPACREELRDQGYRNRHQRAVLRNGRETSLSRRAVLGGPGVTLLGRLELDNFPRPSVARTLSPNGRAHHMARYRAVQAVQTRVALDARMQGLPQMCDGLVVVRPIWTFPITRKHDSDNLSTGVLKAGLDALVRGRWLLDDSSEHVRLEPPEIRVTKGVRMLELIFETSDERDVVAAHQPVGRGNADVST